MTVCTSYKTSYDTLHNQVQKISTPYHGHPFRNSEGIFQLENKEMGEDWNFFVDLEFPRGQSRVYNFLENAYFMALIRLQMQEKLTTLLKEAENIFFFTAKRKTFS